MPPIIVKDNQRVAYIGKTGSGKTTLARFVTAPLPRLIVLDGKGSLGGSDWNLSQSRATKRSLERGDNGRLRVTGVTWSDWQPSLDMAWSIGNVVVYIDEMLLVAPSKPPVQLARLYQIGREKGIGVQASTQRPRNVPAIMLSEAEWIFLFRVSRADDRKAVSDFGDENEVMRRPIHDEHGFYAFNAQWRAPVYYKRFSVRDSVARTNQPAKIAGQRGNVT